MTWRVTVSPGEQQATGTEALAIDVDPRQRVVGLGLRRRSGGSQELFGNVMVRHFVAQATVDWSPAVTWLHTDAAAQLLQTISSGYRAEMVWSGDWVAEWSEEAWTALQQLTAGIESSL